MRRWRIESLVYAAMAAALLVAPTLVLRSWSSGVTGAAPAVDPEGPRLIERIVEVEGWASEGFAGLAEELASRPVPPTWDEVRKVMERRGCTDLRYALRIRCTTSDGDLDDRTLMRRPYHEPQHADEFLRYLRAGPDAAAWNGPGEPPWKAERPGEGPPSPADAP